MANEEAGILTNSRLLLLSRKLTNFRDLNNLAYNGLRLEDHQIESVITNKKDDVQSAAHEILRRWLVAQSNRREAYTNLQAALERCQMHMLATELKYSDFSHLDLSNSGSVGEESKFLEFYICYNLL